MVYMNLSGLLLVVLIGYVAGRTRPIARLSDAAWWRGIACVTDCRYPELWGCIWMLLNPRKTWRAYRRLA